MRYSLFYSKYTSIDGRTTAQWYGHWHVASINNHVTSVFVMTVFLRQPVPCRCACACSSYVCLICHCLHSNTPNALPKRIQCSFFCTVHLPPFPWRFSPFSCHFNSITSMAPLPGLWCWVCLVIPAEETFSAGALPASISLKSRRVPLPRPSWQNM